MDRSATRKCTILDARAWNARYAQKELVWSATPNRFLVEQVADLSPGRALDLAAGEGRNAIWLAERGWQVTGVDFSSTGLDVAREIARRREVEVDWVLADVTMWQPPGATFDLVIVFYLHLPPAARRTAHRNAASAVAPGGTLSVVGHDRDNLTRGVGGPPDATVLLTADEVVDDLRDTGLVVQEATQRLRRVGDPDAAPQQAIDTLVRANRPLA